MNDAEVRGVLHCVASILKDGEMPTAVPAKYQDALQELSDAREDRTDGQKQRYEHAVSGLLPALRPAEASHLSVLKDKLEIDKLMAQWRMVCSWGPAPLPPLIFHQKYEYTYTAQGGETITQIARQFGFESADPLSHPPYGYAPNMRLAKGDVIYVPFPPRRLQNWIDTTEKMIKGAKEGLKEAVETQKIMKENLENYLMKIEALSILANMAKGAVEGIKIGAKAAKAVTNHYAKKITEEMAEWGIDEAKGTSEELLGAAIEASGAPKRGLILALRHFPPLGWRSPAYWASLASAIASGEYEVFLYGPEGIAEKRCEKLAGETSRYIEDLNFHIALMKIQLDSPIYKAKPRQ
jgi:hypothetical protein